MYTERNLFKSFLAVRGVASLIIVEGVFHSSPYVGFELGIIKSVDWLNIRSTIVYGHREFFPKSYGINLKSDCIYYIPIDFDPSGRSFESKSIGKW